MSNTYTFDGTEGGIIPEADARQYIANYKISPIFNLNQNIHGHFFGEDILTELLAQSGSKGLRIYYGLKPSSSSTGLEPQLIIVAADSNGDDILSNAKIADISRPCPIFCPKNEGLIIP